MIFSKNAIALFIMALSLIGVNVQEQTLLEVISAIGTLVSFIVLVINQLERSDISLFFWKKKE